MNAIASKIRWILKGKSGVAATLQTFLARIFILAVNVVTGIITARALGPTGRGEQAAMILWSVFLANTVTLGLPSSLSYNLKRYPERKSELFFAALLIGTFLGGIASAIGIIFMPTWLAQYSPEVIRSAQWFMLNAPIALLFLVEWYALEAEGDFSTSNQIRSLIPFITLIGLCILALAGVLTPFTASLTYVLNGVPVFIWIQIRLWRLFQPQWQGIGFASKRLISYGFRAYGVDLLGALTLQADQVLVVGLLSPGLMGMYVVALSLARMLNVFQTSITTVLFPKASARPIEEVIALTGRSARISAVLTSFAGIVVVLLGPFLLRLLYGAEYLEAVTAFRILVIEVVLSGTTLILAQAFMALGKPGIVTVLQGVGLSFSVPLMLILIPKFGLAGAGLGLLISTTARLIFILVCFPCVLGIRPPGLLFNNEDLQFLKHRFIKTN